MNYEDIMKCLVCVASPCITLVSASGLPMHCLCLVLKYLSSSSFFLNKISELEDSFQDRQRISGGLSSHSFRRNEYGSSPPTRGDLSSYSRGVQGRWESRSVRSDRDNDSQSDWESGKTSD